jgi:hypothetical protein
MSCAEGMNNGPLFGTCSGWNKVFCPVFGAVDGENVVPPCVEDGLISL